MTKARISLPSCSFCVYFICFGCTCRNPAGTLNFEASTGAVENELRSVRDSNSTVEPEVAGAAGAFPAVAFAAAGGGAAAGGAAAGGGGVFSFFLW